MIRVQAVYMQHVHDEKESIQRAKRYLKGVKFDTLVGTGLSGALIIPRIASHFGCNWLIVRKPDDGSHTDKKAEGVLGHRWVFVDDLIDSGTTLTRCKVAVAEIVNRHNEWRDPSESFFKTRFVGTYLYFNHGLPKFQPAPTADALDIAPLNP